MLDVAWLDIGGWAFSGLILVTVWVMVIRGDIVPRSTAQMWQDSWKIEREAGKERDDQITKLLEGQETTNKLVQALHDAALEREQ